MNSATENNAERLRPVRALVVEDSEDDTLLLARQLKEAGYDLTLERVDSPEALTAALAKPWDLVISDFTMPHFSGTGALEIVKKSGLDAPFIFLSGTLGEDTAVAAMKMGAQDYIVKGNTKRLIPAIERELREAEGRRERVRVEEQLRRQQERVRALHEINLAITSTLDLRSVLELLLEKIEHLVPYPMATTVRLFNREKGELEPTTCRNLEEMEWGGNGWRSGRGISQLVFETRAPLVIRDVLKNPGVLDPEFFRKHSLVSYLGVPLMAKEEVLGVLGFYAKEEHHFTEEEIEFLTTLAHHAAIAIHNSQLFEQTREQASELKAAYKVKSEFLSVVSHELRTPLSAIIGYAETIWKSLLGYINPEQEKAMGRILTYAGELEAMINSILDTMRLEAGEIKVESQRVDLRSFLADLKALYETPLGKEVLLVWDCPSELPVIRTDAYKLKHILQNLINNAIKFTDRGRITVSVRVLPPTPVQPPSRSRQRGISAEGLSGCGKWVEFKISDTGIGIPRDSLSAIFEMFRQVNGSKARSHDGVGLGLHIVRRFTDLIGGKIGVESDLDKGSTFTITLPFEPETSSFSPFDFHPHASIPSPRRS